MLTSEAVAVDLMRLGIPPGAGLLVHSSLSRLGRLADGPATVHTALRTALGPDATLVVPAQTPNNSMTSRAFQEATRGMDGDRLATYIGHMPGFDPRNTPSHQVGALAEHIRTRPRAVRSTHPQTSFAALGPAANDWMAIHDLDSHLGERSPLAALYAANAYVLLAGVGYKYCTTFHLAEYRVQSLGTMREYRCFVQVDGQRRDVAFTALDLHDGDFEALGASLQRESFVATGNVGEACAIVFPIRSAVDFAVNWMNMHRSLPQAGSRPAPGP